MLRKRNPLFWGKREINLLQHFALEALEDILNARFLFVKVLETISTEGDILMELYGENAEKKVKEYRMYALPCRVEYEIGEAAAEEVSMRSTRKLKLHLLRSVLKELDYFPQPGDLVLGESRRWYEIVRVTTDEQFFMAAFDTDDDFNFSVLVEAVEVSQSRYEDIPLDVSEIPPVITAPVGVAFALYAPTLNVENITI